MQQTTAYLNDPDFTLYHGDVLDVLRELPAESIQMCVTSPPYWGLRDYGLEPSIWGGDPECAHEWASETVSQEMRYGLGLRESPASTRGGAKKIAEVPNVQAERAMCHCGAWRGCLGLEPTPDLFVEHLVLIFREVRRVLRKDGTVWLNLGDSYASTSTYNTTQTMATEHGWKQDGQRRPNVTVRRQAQVVDGKRVDPGGGTAIRPPAVEGLKQKDLCMIPALAALALRADGWYLRSQIVWAKPNPMPESVTDRPTTSHEFIYLLARSPNYYFDQDAVRERFSTKHAPGSKVKETQHYGADNGGNAGLTGHLADVKARLRAEGAPQAETLGDLPPEAPRGPDGRRRTGVKAGENSMQHRDGERWPERPQTRRAIELFREAGLTDEHLAAIKAVGMNDAGKAQVTQSGYGKNDPEVQRLADEAKAALGGYYREFLIPAGRNMRSVWNIEEVESQNPTWEERKAAGATRGNLAHGDNVGAGTQRAVHGEGLSHDLGDPTIGRNVRSVWEIATHSYPDAHFATWPPELVRRCILAGTSEMGACPDCGAPFEREVEREQIGGQPLVSDQRKDLHGPTYSRHRSSIEGGQSLVGTVATTLGWRPTCKCDQEYPAGYYAASSKPVPCTVMDIFMGSGTTAEVARKLGRRAVGIEKNEDYCALAAKRTQQQSLLAEED